MKFLRLLLVMMVFSGASRADQGDWQYTVKDKDTIWAVCERYVAEPLCWKKLTEYNQITTPKYLPPGTVLDIPKAWLIQTDSTALVIAVEGKVLVGRNGITPDTEVKVGDKLLVDDMVVTHQGSAMIEFADGSRLLLKAHSQVRMDTLKYDDAANIAKSRIELIKGRLKSQVEKQVSGKGVYQILTPAAVAAVRGTEFRVARSEQAETGKVVMTTELLTGSLAIQSENEEQALSAGQALIATQDEALPEPITLLPRPTTDLNQLKEFKLPAVFTWHAVQGAAHYMVSLSDNNSLLWEKQTEQPQLEIGQLEGAELMLRIRAVDAAGIEGRDRKIRITLPDTQ